MLHYTDTMQYDDDDDDNDDSSIQAAMSLFDEGELHNSAAWLQFSLLCVFNNWFLLKADEEFLGEMQEVVLSAGNDDGTCACTIYHFFCIV